MTDDEFEHVWDKLNKAKATTANVTVAKAALMNVMMHLGRREAELSRITKLLHSGKKMGEIAALAENHADQDHRN